MKHDGNSGKKAVKQAGKCLRIQIKAVRKGDGPGRATFEIDVRLSIDFILQTKRVFQTLHAKVQCHVRTGWLCCSDEPMRRAGLARQDSVFCSKFE